jgi:type I restriction enzyme S subunit
MEIMTETKLGYKQTKLGWIPEDWDVLKLKDISKRITSGSTPLRSYSQYFENPTVHWVKTTDLNNGNIWRTEELISEYAVSDINLKILPKETVLVAMYGGFNQIGRTGILKIESTINQALTAIEVDKNTLTPDYLISWLNYGIGYWKRYAASSRKDPNITKKDVQDFLVAFGSLEEQKAIAACLGSWDKAIDTLSQLIAQREQRKKGLMQQLLTGKKRLPGFSDEWREVVFSDVAKRVSRRNSELNDNVVTISAQRGFVRQEDFFNKRVASDTLANYYLVEKGEFAYNKSYSNGYPMGAFKRLDDFDKAVVTTLYICFKIKKGAEPDFMKHYFDAGLMNKGLTRIAQEGGRAHGLLNIGLSDFFSLPLEIPKLKEQQAIAEVLNAANTEINLLQQKLKQLKQQKKGLMQQLLTGKKRLV